MRILSINRGLTGSAPVSDMRPEFWNPGHLGHLDAPAEIPYGGTRNITPDWDDLAVITSETYRPGVLSYDY